MPQQKRVLLIIVIAQFCCTALWFAGNAVISNLIADFNLDPNVLGYLTSAVQFGFILGTLVFAIGMVADRYSPSKVFFASALLGALFNLGIIWKGNTLVSLLIFRFLIGFFLAGIYPVGMKIATDYFDKGLGKSLSFLVGALVLGTAFPHLLKGLGTTIPWVAIVIATSLIAVVGGCLIFFLVPDGPYRKQGRGIELSAFFKVFKNNRFRMAAFAYFGHMWELYTFWAFVPIMLHTYTKLHPTTTFNIPLLSFLIIGMGSVACFWGGYISQLVGVKRTAFGALFLSGMCCLFSPFFFSLHAEYWLIVFLCFWGMVVVADSPLFSTLVAQSAIPELKGTALTIVNCIGYSITIVSIQLMSMLNTTNSSYTYTILAVGPFMGLIALSRER